MDGWMDGWVEIGDNDFDSNSNTLAANMPRFDTLVQQS